MPLFPNGAWHSPGADISSTPHSKCSSRVDYTSTDNGSRSEGVVNSTAVLFDVKCAHGTCNPTTAVVEPLYSCTRSGSISSHRTLSVPNYLCHTGRATDGSCDEVRRCDVLFTEFENFRSDFTRIGSGRSLFPGIPPHYDVKLTRTTPSFISHRRS